ncbi:integration host factor, actinobacterial type [Nonomuraea typhae]|uniref:integration host factor, actinobacterial type n=1 Tax=Nonomuraea typhae TaxID=2603600 RepID=UPI0015E1FF8F|nr:integration host factor, actinobacterial type [Nonomuraea typhae]
MTPEQRALAVVKAAETRKARSELLAGVRAGTVTVAEVFARAEEETVVQRMRVVQVLRAVPGLGPATVAAVMATCGVEVKRRIGGLGEAQCERLLTALAR